MNSGSATVASPSSCDRLEMILDADAATQPLLGAMLAVDVPFDDAIEVALGTITTIETVNPILDPRGPMASHVAAGATAATDPTMDNRRVVMKVEAVFRGQPGQWRKWSSTLSNSPATGSRVRILDQQTADDLMAEVSGAGYIGHLRGGRDVLLPMTLTDFSGPRGARHCGVFGLTGAGKTVFSAYLLSTMMRHPKMAFLITDPQGQFSGEYGLPISLQGVATALGRQVHVARISQSLRLQKDAPMFLHLLQEAGLFRMLAFGAGADEQMAAAREVWRDALQRERDVAAACGTDDWTEADSAQLLRYLLQILYDLLPTGTVYAGRDQQDRVAATLIRPTEDSRGEPIPQHLQDRLPAGALDAGGADKFNQMLEVFAALHQLWLPYNAAGLNKISEGAAADSLGDEFRRRSAWGLLAAALRPPENTPAPVVILDLSADVAAGGRAAEILDNPDVKARIIRQLVATTKRVGQAEFSNGRQLNVAWIVDEAWAWMGPIDSRTQSEAIVALSNEFVAAARDVRKFGVGLFVVSQSISSIREDVVKQLGVLFVGYGLHDAGDLKRLGNRISESHLQLYKAAPPPEATGRYIWMCVGGGVTGLSFGPNPVFVEVFTDVRDWLAHNEHWITELRRQYLHCLPAGDAGGPLTTPPSRPAIGDAAAAAHTAVADVRSAPIAADTLAAFGRRGPTTGAGTAPAGGRWATAVAADDDLPPF